MFTDPGFAQVPRRPLKDLYFAIMTLYHEKFKDLPIAFAPSHVEMPLAQVNFPGWEKASSTAPSRRSSPM